jgi:hypothetical protein
MERGFSFGLAKIVDRDRDAGQCPLVDGPGLENVRFRIVHGGVTPTPEGRSAVRQTFSDRPNPR